MLLNIPRIGRALRLARRPPPPRHSKLEYHCTSPSKHPVRVSSATKFAIFAAGVLALAIAACGGATTPSAILPTPELFDAPTPTSEPLPLDRADVIDVSISGVAGDYSLSVTVASPDIGCSPYVDWWEVISEEGELLTRRVLLHAHVDEQPFTRSMGGLKVQPGEQVMIRAHMNDAGYGSTVMRGTVADGFSQGELDGQFAGELETQRPLPGNCTF